MKGAVAVRILWLCAQDVQQGDVLHCIEVEMVQPDKEAVLGDVSLQNKA